MPKEFKVGDLVEVIEVESVDISVAGICVGDKLIVECVYPNFVSVKNKLRERRMWLIEKQKLKIMNRMWRKIKCFLIKHSKRFIKWLMKGAKKYKV